MAERAAISDINELKFFRARMIKLAEIIRNALSEADADASRSAAWVSRDAPNHWQQRLRQLNQQLQQAKAALRDKKLTKSATGGSRSSAFEQRQLRLVQQKIEHATSRLTNAKRWQVQIEKEMLVYRGAVRRANDVVERIIPNAVRELDRASDALQRYTRVAAPEASGPTPTGAAPSIRRAPGDPPEPPTPTDAPPGTPTPPDTPAPPGTEPGTDAPTPDRGPIP